MSANRAIRSVMFQKYGNLISSEEPVFDEVTRTWQAALKSDYPRFIRDDINPEKRMIKFITLRGLGGIRLSEQFKLVEATPRETCVENLGKSIRLWQEGLRELLCPQHLGNLPE